MQKTVLGIDASTTTIGYTVLSITDKKVEVTAIDYITLSNYDELIEKADYAEIRLREVIEKYTPVEICIEEDLQRFTKGRSSSQVLRKLSRFNGMVTYILYKLSGVKPKHVDPSHARRIVGCVIKNTKPNTTKQQVLAWVKKRLTVDWPKKTVTRGKFKGQTQELKECFDMADSYVIACASSAIT